MRKKRAEPFGLNPCSLCEKFDVTFGEQKMGGVRWCQDCLKESFGWVQMTQEQREKLTAIYAKHKADPKVAAALAVLAKVPEETRKSIAIGESRRRLMESDR